MKELVLSIGRFLAALGQLALALLWLACLVFGFLVYQVERAGKQSGD